jgi:hypothetical protein
MNSFDQRAEASAGRGGRRDQDPQRAQIRAVRKALKSQQQEFKDAFISIDTFMELRTTQNLPEPGSNSSNLLIAQFRRVAVALRKTRDAVNAVDFDAGDKRDLRKSLLESAKSWEARAIMSETRDVAQVNAAAAAIEKHDDLALQFGKPVRKYYGEKEEGAD